MNGFGNWLRSFFSRVSLGLRRFMQGRYGVDKLNMLLLWIGVGFSVLSMLLPFAAVKLILSLISYVFLIFAVFRALSRQTYKRYRENRRYLRFLERLRDREHRYFDCPRCHQPVRVPRGKGKISIRCPKCNEKFIRKT